MSYVKNTWTNGDTITAEKLNNMENGIESASGVLVVGVTNNVMDKTWQEIYDALTAGLRVVTISTASDSIHQTIISSAFIEDNEYYVDLDSVDYSTGASSGYPRHIETPVV